MNNPTNRWPELYTLPPRQYKNSLRSTTAEQLNTEHSRLAAKLLKPNDNSLGRATRPFPFLLADKARRHICQLLYPRRNRSLGKEISQFSLINGLFVDMQSLPSNRHYLISYRSVPNCLPIGVSDNGNEDFNYHNKGRRRSVAHN